MTALFSPLELRETTIPNRVMVSPMCQYSCEERDGLATDWHDTHLGSRAVGGAGLVMAEATAVEPRGRITPEDLGIWSDEHAAALADTTDFVREQGSVPPSKPPTLAARRRRPDRGRTAYRSPGRRWLGSPVTERRPLALRGRTARHASDGPGGCRSGRRLLPRRSRARPLDAGFEVAEVHAAHGYLLHEFLSPVTNHREDDYGGNFEGRIRLTREVTAAVREVWPDDKPVFVRISATDWLDDRESWTVDQSVRLADRLHEVGADLIDVSSGGISPESWPASAGPNYQLPLAEHIREKTESDIRVGAVGGITTPQQAEGIVANDRADMAIVGREHLRDPLLRAARRRGTGRDGGGVPTRAVPARVRLLTRPRRRRLPSTSTGDTVPGRLAKRPSASQPVRGSPRTGGGRPPRRSSARRRRPGSRGWG